ncbi:MAG: UDP-N-acetylmuramyl-tripeptide synthetase [Candidatus Uhrbacteria bacterium GW2011_GWD2_52_7]|uniref:UDP-N-acetylmuramyl-tripeptide synthetase n=1 Tax=Candidatus Uhrbacteria bacterium GW2011_GWD2_52_7 TaxID=1618989 RepID=A0A0G1XCU2_9BACT|nr:MAG: UDP-N-acetylmuramyl-tripeptide synthetase [Candidatus Uhrbacteria bacterium GW2011_GWD2_52_7]
MPRDPGRLPDPVTAAGSLLTSGWAANMSSTLKALVPKPMIGAYHYVLARTAELLYGHPSDRLVVLGITGTNGKSSTTQFVAQILTELGAKVGYTSTAGFAIAGETIENRMKMTMPGRFTLQKLLRRMVTTGCTHAVIETSSQGLIQHRHLGINYDVALFTNLTPEHIEAHGGFEHYKQAKGILFSHLTRRRHKTIGGKHIPKVNVVNADDEHAPFYAKFPADRHVSFGWKGEHSNDRLVAKLVGAGADGMIVEVNGLPFRLSLHAEFERLNALAAIAAVHSLVYPLNDVLRAAESLRSVPGRFEWIRAGQPFAVIVDYAYEPFALESLFRSLAPFHFHRVIGVHGSAGGGRDVARRPVIGKLAAQHEDIVVVTNEDPYQEDPRAIMAAVAAGARQQGKVDGKDLFVIEDRQAAIDRAIGLAQPGDVVLLTGKGSEPVMAVASGSVPWDDREAARKALAKLGYRV